MIVGVGRLLEYKPRLLGEKHFVGLVVHEPPKLGGKRPNRKKIVPHAVDKGIGGNSGVARQRGVADEIGSFETLVHRRPAGDAGRRVKCAAKEETQSK